METWEDVAALFPHFGPRLLVAMLCGLILGVERERKDKPAGLRTILLITTGAALYMIVSELIPLITEGPESITRVDPSRIASQVVTGIGFLGAGTIIQSRGSVHGLTTAAVIWVAAAIGLCTGIGYPLFAIAVTLLILAALVVMDPLRAWLSRRGAAHTFTLYASNDDLVVKRLQLTLMQQDVRGQDMRVEKVSDEQIRLTFTYHGHASSTHRLIETLASIDGVHGEPYVR